MELNENWEFLKRLKNAFFFRILFLRRAWYKMPRKIWMNGRFVFPAFPEEHGMKIDFLTCFIDDCYGLNQFTHPTPSILDIGSNVGFFSLAARAYFPGGVIHSYEPNPRIHAFIRKNSRLGGFVFYPQAVGCSNGFVNILDDHESNQVQTELSPQGAIPCVSISNAIQRLGGKVNLVKLDCEGAEWDIFQDEASLKNMENIRMEYHLFGRQSLDELKMLLQDNHFFIQKVVPSGSFGLLWAKNGRAVL